MSTNNLDNKINGLFKVAAQTFSVPPEVLPSANSQEYGYKPNPELLEQINTLSRSGGRKPTAPKASSRTRQFMQENQQPEQPTLQSTQSKLGSLREGMSKRPVAPKRSVVAVRPEDADSYNEQLDIITESITTTMSRNPLKTYGFINEWLDALVDEELLQVTEEFEDKLNEMDHDSLVSMVKLLLVGMV